MSEVRRIDNVTDRQQLTIGGRQQRQARTLPRRNACVLQHLLQCVAVRPPRQGDAFATPARMHHTMGQWHSGFLPGQYQGVFFQSQGDPVLFLEHKKMYRAITGPAPEPGVEVPLGAARVVREV